MVSLGIIKQGKNSSFLEGVIGLLEQCDTLEQTRKLTECFSEDS